MHTERLESMSPHGFLRLIRQDDGDIVLVVAQCKEISGAIVHTADVEFCTPGAGRGGSRRTYAALVQLMAAMAEDNLDPEQDRRRPTGLNMEEQEIIAAWGSETKDAIDAAIKETK